MKQLLLKISTPADRPPLFASDFREMLAKAGDGLPALSPAFFHYGADGKPLSSASPNIRIVGGRNWVGILSKNGESALLDPAIGLASRVVGNCYGAPVPITIEEREYGLESSLFPVVYAFRDVAIKRRTDVARASSDEDLIRLRLVQHLESEANAQGFDLPIAAALQITIHEVRACGMRLRTTSGFSNEYVHLLNGELSMYLTLKGIWQFGNLQSRGYGRLINLSNLRRGPQ